MSRAGGRPPSRRPSLATAALAASVAAFAASAVAQSPTYVDRLALPVATDSIRYPRTVAVDHATGEIFVADTRGNRILIFDPEGLFSYQIVGGGDFSAPRGIAVDPEGLLLIIANRERRPAILELDFDGLFRRPLPLTGLPADVREPAPSSIAVSPSGDRLYVVDNANLRLWIADRDGGLLGSVDFGAEVDEDLRRDLILGKVDVYGDAVVIAEPTLGQVRIFELDGSARGRIGLKGTAPCRLGFPVAAALDRDGNLLVIDQQRMVLMRWSQQNRCLAEYIGGGAAPGFLYYPMDMALDAQGRVLIAQGFEGRVQLYGGMTPAATATDDDDDSE